MALNVKVKDELQVATPEHPPVPCALTTEEILAEREKTHGDFSHHARTTQDLKRCFLSYCQSPLSDVQQEAIDMIMHKLGRIAAGNPNVRDHWDDIAGYARLAADRCNELNS